ncbi:helix-turn-helix domain-containing protein [Bacillus sp. S10(2024)]|uniref:helix-turn-helix domain-containing protein n=1 Tax=Bacillus sp. S10(2024) TaxID=3162886 RepID=UPI003D1A3664
MEFGRNVKKERKKKNLTLDDLAKKSNVSKSMLSMIERSEKTPTIQVASQIAEGLELTISKLLGEQTKKEILVIRSDQRLIYKEEKSGFERHLLSPSFPTKGLEFILNVLPPLQETGIFSPHKQGVEEYIYIAKGKLKVELGNTPEIYNLEEGDSIYFEADIKHRFINVLNEECHYYLIINSYPANTFI